MQTGRADLDAMLKVSTIPADEPVFILRAQDATAAETVRAWAALQLTQDGGSRAVAESALRQADAMDQWPIKKLPGDDHWTADERRQLEYAISQRAYRARGDDADLRLAMAERRGGDLAASRLARAFADTLPFQNMALAPDDGSGFLAFGIHTHAPAGAETGVKAGDYWWAITRWDKWSEPHQWVFSKDGAPTWSEPLAWLSLKPPANVDELVARQVKRAELVGREPG